MDKLNSCSENDPHDITIPTSNDKMETIEKQNESTTDPTSSNFGGESSELTTSPPQNSQVDVKPFRLGLNNENGNDINPNGRNLIPLYSREMTMQAHITFSASNAKGSQGTSSVPTLQQPIPSNVQHQWKDDVAHCFIKCGNDGLTMSYDSPSGPSVPTHLQRPSMLQIQNNSPRPIDPGGNFCPGRSATFSGGNRTPRLYGRRCKSTAHIVLQNSDSSQPSMRSHEFNGDERGRGGRGRGRGHGNDKPSDNRNTKEYLPGGWEEPHEHFYPSNQWCGASHLPPPCCSCPHCSALFTLVSSLTQDRPCPHHAPHCPYHGHPERQHVSSTHTFNSHRCYEHSPCRNGRTSPSHSSSKRREPTPDRRFPSPHRDCAPPPPSATDQSKSRRVPRMGAAAASYNTSAQVVN